MRKHVALHEHILNSQCESLNSQWEEIREHIEKDDLLEFREEFVNRYTKKN